MKHCGSKLTNSTVLSCLFKLNKVNEIVKLLKALSREDRRDLDFLAIKEIDQTLRIHYQN